MTDYRPNIATKQTRSFRLAADLLWASFVIAKRWASFVIAKRCQVSLSEQVVISGAARPLRTLMSFLDMQSNLVACVAPSQ